MAESVWLEQLQAFTEHLTAARQKAAAAHTYLADWLLHQQGLFALGIFFCPACVLGQSCRAQPALLCWQAADGLLDVSPVWLRCISPIGESHCCWADWTVP